MVPVTQAHHSFYVNGDPIGSSSDTTDNTGGFTAVQQDGGNLGQPAILVSLTGQELLVDFRVIVFGLPSIQENLLFNSHTGSHNITWNLASHGTFDLSPMARAE
jgi:hypothetical protein